MLASNVLDDKKFNHERELDGIPFVFPESWDKFALVVALGIELFFKQLIGQESCLWESIHAFVGFDEDATAGGGFFS